jgi:trehalose-6-phosphatase
MQPVSGLKTSARPSRFTTAGRRRSRCSAHAQALEKVHASFSRWLRVAGGDHTWEVMPYALRGKGHTVRRYLRYVSRHALPIYIGDDAADEPAFAALSQGITACVGPARQTRATFRLRNPVEVRRALENLDLETR